MANLVGERIKELRLARRLTQDELAARIGVSRQTVSNWEVSRTNVSTTDVPAIAAALGVTAAQLYGDGPDPPGVASRRHDPLDVEGQRNADVFNVWGRREDMQAPGIAPLPVYRWGSLGDPRDRESAPYPDRMDYPPMGRERLVGPNGFGVDVRGDSMGGRGIRDGDTCWVNPDKPYRLGDVVLASVDTDGESGMVVKTYAHTEVGDCLVSELDSGKSTVVCDQFRIIGPVVLVSPRPFPPR